MNNTISKNIQASVSREHSLTRTAPSIVLLSSDGGKGFEKFQVLRDNFNRICRQGLSSDTALAAIHRSHYWTRTDGDGNRNWYITLDVRGIPDSTLQEIVSFWDSTEPEAILENL